MRKFLLHLGNWSIGSGPLHARLSRGIQSAIQRGLIMPGSRLPAERELAKALAVSRTTVVTAYTALQQAACVESRRGSGTFALGGRERLALARQLVPIPDDLRSVASNTDERVLAFERVPTPEFLRREWRDFGETALLIRRIRYLEDDPVVLSTTYVPEPVARRLTSTD